MNEDDRDNGRLSSIHRALAVSTGIERQLQLNIL